jgi:hypothetical protein
VTLHNQTDVLVKYMRASQEGKSGSRDPGILCIPNGSLVSYVSPTNPLYPMYPQWILRILRIANRRATVPARVSWSCSTAPFTWAGAVHQLFPYKLGPMKGSFRSSWTCRCVIASAHSSRELSRGADEQFQLSWAELVLVRQLQLHELNWNCHMPNRQWIPYIFNGSYVSSFHSRHLIWRLLILNCILVLKYYIVGYP